MRIDLPPQQARRKRAPERIAILLVVLVIGAVLGAALGALQPAASGTLSGIARDLLNGPSDGRLPPLLLDLHFRALQALRERREAWRAQGLRPSPSPSAVTGGLREGQSEFDVAVSLLGPAHGRAPGQLGRMLIETRGDGDFFGMRAFALEDPAEPSLVRELLLYHALGQGGALAPRVMAVGLRVNGERWGTAVAVEQPSTALVRAAHRPLGALVGWEAKLPDGADLDAGTWLAQAQPARWSTSARGLQGTPLEVHTAWAQARLDGLRAGTIAPEDALDVEATARVMALAELFGLADRVLEWESLRWYLNPVSLRLEPVVRLEPELPGPHLRADALWPRLLASARVRQAFTTILRAEAEHVLAVEPRTQLLPWFAAIWPTLPDETWQRQWLAVRQRAMRSLSAERVASEPMSPPPAVFLPQQVTDAHQALPFALDAGLPQAHALMVPPGTWRVPSTVALPDGWRLELAPGAKLLFGAGAWLILHGGLTVAGTSEAPVTLAGDGTQTWGGVAVLGAHQSHVAHLRVSGADGRGRDVWQPGAALLWADGDVDVTDLLLTGTPGLSAGVRVVAGKWHGQDVTIRSVPGEAIHSDGADLRLANWTVEQGGVGLAAIDGSVSVRASKAKALHAAWLRVLGDVRAVVADVTVVDVGVLVEAREGAWVQIGGVEGNAREVACVANGMRTRTEGPTHIETAGLKLRAPKLARCSGGAAIAIDGTPQPCADAEEAAR